MYKSTSRGSGIGCTERKVVVAAENTVSAQLALLVAICRIAAGSQLHPCLTGM